MKRRESSTRAPSLHQRRLERLRRGDGAERRDIGAPEGFERLVCPGEHLLQMPGPVRAFDDLGRAVVAADARDERGVVAPSLLVMKICVARRRLPGRFAQRAARQEVLVAERGLPVDQHEVQPVLEVQVLQAVVEDERVRAEMFDRVPPGLDAVLVHEHDDAGQVRVASMNGSSPDSREPSRTLWPLLTTRGMDSLMRPVNRPWSA